MNITNRYRQDRINKTREYLAANLEPGETLLEVCQVRYAAGIWTSKEVWIGLTEQRLVFAKPNIRANLLSIPLAFIAKLAIGPATTFGRKPTLHLEWRDAPPEAGPKAGLTFTLSSFWVKQGMLMAEMVTQAKETGNFGTQPPTVSEFIELLQGLQKIGAEKEARILLETRFATDPFLAANPDAQDMRHLMNEGKLAMRVASAMYAVVILFIIYATVNGNGTIGLGIIFALWAIIDLVRGNSGARTGALTLALLTAGLNAILALIAKSPVDVILWVAFGAAMTLLLVGKPNRMRIELGIGVFLVGSVGILAFFLLGARYFPDQVSWLMSGATNEVFADDFSKDQGWTQSNSENAASKLENGAYFLTVKTPGMLYFSFPPVSYIPEKGEVDLQILDSDASGQYAFTGMVCHYQKDAHRYYMVYVDPILNRYLVDQISGEDEVVLTNPVWQSAKGLKTADQVNHIGLTCSNNQIVLTINGIQQPAVKAPGMAQFGAGKMGLMVVESEDSEAAAVKVKFDNAKFWPAE